jgi:hypothetical protein
MKDKSPAFPKDRTRNLSARFIFGRIPRTIAENWMLPK